MTKMTSVFNNYFQQRLKLMGEITGIELIATVLTLLYRVIKGQFVKTDLMDIFAIYLSIAFVLVFILLARQTERVYSNNYDRLVPISNTRFYLANMLSTVASSIVFVIGQDILIVLISLIQGENISFDEPWSLITGILLFFLIMLPLFIWSMVSLIHLTTVSISTFLPEMRQRIFKGILYIAVIVVVIRLSSWLLNLIGKYLIAPMMSNNMTNFSNGAMNFNYTGSSIYLASLMMLIFIALISVINCYLLDHFVETNAGF